MPSQLTIQQIELYKISIPLTEPFVISLGPIYSAENLLVIIRTKEGLVGFGECSPFMSINGESADTCMVVGGYFARLLKNKNALDISSHIEAMDKLIYSNTSIKSAFDMALYDLASQHAGLPLYKFLGGKNNKTIVTDYTVSIGEPAQMAVDAQRIQAQGYPSIKIKVGKHGPTDVERIRQIREAVGPTIPLRIDANQGWLFDEAVETLNAMAVYRIEHCEEPIPRWAILDLPKLRELSPIPIMSDESCGDDHDAERLIRLKACDYMNIKLGKSGGIFKALKMVRMAEDAGVPLQVGAFMESRLAMTAFAHFSLCSPIIRHYDFDTALMFSSDPVTGGIVYEKNGVISVPEGNGLGASMSPAALEGFDKVVY
ncbi:MAG: dipeptide epimerase [Chitinophagaceae bacterium]